MWSTEKLKKWLVFACIAMSLIGFLSPLIGALRTLKDRKSPTIDDRYSAICAVLPADPVLEYISDLPDRGKGAEIYFQAQYSFAPHLLVEGSRRPFAVANLSEPKHLLQICRDHQMIPVAVDADGVALLRSIGN